MNVMKMYYLFEIFLSEICQNKNISYYLIIKRLQYNIMILSYIKKMYYICIKI